MKGKLKGAETGHSLLKRKSEALTKYAPTCRRMKDLTKLFDAVDQGDFEVKPSRCLSISFDDSQFDSEITRRIDEAKRKMGRVMQIAAFSLAEVTYAVGGDIGYQIQESAKNARFRLRTKQENVSGVYLPQFESSIAEGSNDFGLTGLGKGGQQVQRCRETYARAVETLIELASLQVKYLFRLSHRIEIILILLIWDVRRLL